MISNAGIIHQLCGAGPGEPDAGPGPGGGQAVIAAAVGAEGLLRPCQEDGVAAVFPQDQHHQRLLVKGQGPGTLAPGAHIGADPDFAVAEGGVLGVLGGAGGGLGGKAVGVGFQGGVDGGGHAVEVRSKDAVGVHPLGELIIGCIIHVE